MPVATLTSKGQLTVPKTIRELLGISQGDRIVFLQDESGRVYLEAATVDISELDGLLHQPGRATVTLEEMDEAIAAHHRAESKRLDAGDHSGG